MLTTTPTLLTVRQFSERHRAFTESSLRWLIFQAKPRISSRGEMPGNGLQCALVRLGRRLLIDEAAFFAWLEQQQGASV